MKRGHSDDGSGWVCPVCITSGTVSNCPETVDSCARCSFSRVVKYSHPKRKKPGPKPGPRPGRKSAADAPGAADAKPRPRGGVGKGVGGGALGERSREGTTVLDGGETTPAAESAALGKAAHGASSSAQALSPVVQQGTLAAAGKRASSGAAGGSTTKPKPKRRAKQTQRNNALLDQLMAASLQPAPRAPSRSTGNRPLRLSYVRDIDPAESDLLESACASFFRVWRGCEVRLAAHEHRTLPPRPA